METPTIILASAPEVLLWLLVGLVWLVIQGLQRSMRNKNRRTPSPEPDIPAPPGNMEHRDLDDFIADIFERATNQEPVPPAPPVSMPAAQAPPKTDIKRQPPPPVAAVAPRRRQAPTAPRPAPAKPAALPQPTVAERPDGIALHAFRTGTFMRDATLPAMPAMQPRPNSNRPAHPMTTALKTGLGARHAILWREVMGRPRALLPY